MSKLKSVLGNSMIVDLKLKLSPLKIEISTSDKFSRIIKTDRFHKYMSFIESSTCPDSNEQVYNPITQKQYFEEHFS